jgi:hypothetical protein
MPLSAARIIIAEDLGECSTVNREKVNVDDE